MSKSAMIIMAVLLLSVGSMMFAADLVLGPVKEDIALARELIGDLDNRGWLTEDKPRPDDRVRVRTLKGGVEGRLSELDAWGAIVEVRPSLETLRTRDRLGALAAVVLERIEDHNRVDRLHWVELAVLHEDREVVRSLIEWHPGGGWRAPNPPLPSSWEPVAPATAPAPEQPTAGG